MKRESDTDLSWDFALGEQAFKLKSTKENQREQMLTYEKLLSNNYLGKIMNFMRNFSMKMSPFPGDFEGARPLKNSEKINYRIINFVNVSCQRASDNRPLTAVIVL